MRKARAEGFRSRAAYKLLEIDTRDRLFFPGALVVDLGAAPGGWAQVAAQRVAPGGRVIAVDLLEFAPISAVTVLRGDCREAGIQAQLVEALGGRMADVVLSDMSPNLSGIASTDQARAADLVQVATEFCRERLQEKGVLLVKVFQGGDFARLLKELRGMFKTVRTLKPAASREESRETYLLARGLKGLQ